MIVEILFNEVCGLYGDSQNAQYLEQTLPEAEFIYTQLTEKPYFVDNQANLIYIGSMSERTQRTVLEKLMPYKERIRQLVDNGTPILATGNASELFAERIEYVTEGITVDGLGFFDLTVKTDLFDRYNGKVIGAFGEMTIVGFRSQFSFLFGDNSQNFFVRCRRGDGINRQSKLEGMRLNNLICTQILGPILPLNPLFTEYLIGLAGSNNKAAHREAAMCAYEQRIHEFSDPDVVFGNNK
jgi:CobQ-like glutamine amidotransferase family enzyme